MKRIFSIFLVICLCIPFLTSCSSNPQSADALWEKINKTMDSLKSYEANGKGTMSFQKRDTYFTTAEFTRKTIIANANKKNFYYYSASEITAPDIHSIQSKTTKSIEAFHDGNMFISMDSNIYNQKLRSSLTAKEYRNYREKQTSFYGNIDIANYTEASFTHNEDKTWTLTFSGYTNKTLEQTFDSFGFDKNVFVYDIRDMEVTIQADKKFRVKEMKIKFVYDEKDIDRSPSFEFVTEYSKYNQAEMITDTINPENYEEIADCRLISDLADMFKKLEEDKEGSFVTDMEQTVIISGKEKHYTETNTVSYGKKDGKYFYDVTIQSSSDGEKNISYTNGIQTIETSGKKQSKEQSKSEAKAFVNDLINSIPYNPYRITDIKKTEDNVYEIQYPLSHPCETVFGSYKFKTTDFFQQTWKFTVKDGNIVKIEHHVQAKGTAAAGNYPLEIHIVSTNTFNP